MDVRACSWLPLMATEPPEAGQRVRLAMSVVTLTFAPEAVLDWLIGIRPDECTWVDPLAGWLLKGAAAPFGLEETEVGIYTQGKSANS